MAVAAAQHGGGGRGGIGGPRRSGASSFVSTGFFETIRPRVLAGRLPAPGEHSTIAISERVLRHDGTAATAAVGTILTLIDKSFATSHGTAAGTVLARSNRDFFALKNRRAGLQANYVFYPH